jgi:riboflavin kinase/FMN adenylyltransferase
LGYNHHFGSDRQGDINVIKEFGHKLGFEAEKAGPIEMNGEKVSSSKIRHALSEGHLDLANNFLGYEYFLRGTVGRGQELGRTIGFPTANIEVDDETKLLPRDGVYAVKVKINAKIFKGMLNIGYRPTVNREKHHKTIEVHILDFNENIYGLPIQVSFIKHIRDEIKFSGIENLKAQLMNDKIRVMDCLS